MHSADRSRQRSIRNRQQNGLTMDLFNLTVCTVAMWVVGEKKNLLQNAAVSSADTLECVGAAVGVGRAAERQFPKSFLVQETVSWKPCRPPIWGSELR